ncbi:MAG TPA: amidohydrolase family protein [Burkholderiales bacterium]|nr:amidohydrolase family protein [Burkholderiales bacterium]
MNLLSEAERAGLAPAEFASFDGPIPTQIVSSDEYAPIPQTPAQREVESRLKRVAGELAARQGMTRRRFLRTAAGMAAAFAAMNDVYGPLFEVARAEAATPELAAARSEELAGQFVFDGHTHFLRDDTRIETFVRMREAVGKAGWNPELVDRPQTIEDLKFDNYVKEIYLDSDTKIALISSAPSDVAADWFLTNPMTAAARLRINGRFGARRMLNHAIFTPGQPGWLDEVDRAIAEDQPDAFKGYTIGDNTHKDLSRYPWRLDDEKLVYPFYEKIRAAGLRNVCVHKGLFPPSAEAQFPHLRAYTDVRDVARAARDWPDLNFVVYHSAYRFPGGGTPEEALALFEDSGRIDWVTDLAEIPARHGVTNVYGDLGQVFAMTTVAQPRLAAAIMGALVKGLGADHVVWGTDAVWTGAPQWQIESLRRLEIPEDMQRRFGYAPLGSATGEVKSAIFGMNSARLYGIEPTAYANLDDGLAKLKREYRASGGLPSNLRYGYVKSGA